MILTFNPDDGTISRPNGRVAAYMSHSAHEADPTLGHKMAAAGEMHKAGWELDRLRLVIQSAVAYVDAVKPEGANHYEEVLAALDANQAALAKATP